MGLPGPLVPPMPEEFYAQMRAAQQAMNAADVWAPKTDVAGSVIDGKCEDVTERLVIPLPVPEK